MSTFGENLKRIRKEKGLTQQEVAAGMGVSSVFISYYEKDTRKPKPETIRRFAAALHCSIDDLLKDTSLDELGLYTDYSYPLGVNVIRYKDDLREDEIKLLDIFRQLNDKGKLKVLEYSRDLLDNTNYVKEKKNELPKF